MDMESKASWELEEVLRVWRFVAHMFGMGTSGAQFAVVLE